MEATMTVEVPVAAGLELKAFQSAGSNNQALADKNHQRRSHIKSEELPIRVRIVRTPEQLEGVCELRSLAYGQRNPALGELLKKPEEVDFDPGTVVLLAESKEDGQAVGSMRIHTNLFQPVPMQSVVDMPENLQGQLLAEACRFCARPSFNSPMVRLSLFKAIYLYCFANQVQFLLCGARAPLNELYKSLGMVPLDGGSEEIWRPVSYAGNLDHSMLMLDVLLAEKHWRESGHPCYEFVGRTYHPDIQIFSAVSSVWARSRADDRR
jgi:hypothetical protein